MKTKVSLLLMLFWVPAFTSDEKVVFSHQTNSSVRVKVDVRNVRLSVEIGHGENNVVYLVTGAEVESDLVKLVVRVPLRSEEFLLASKEQRQGVRAGVYSFASAIVIEGKRGFMEFLRTPEDPSNGTDLIELERLQNALRAAAERGWNVYDVKPANVVDGYLIDAAFERTNAMEAAWNNEAQFVAYLQKLDYANQLEENDQDSLYRRFSCAETIQGSFSSYLSVSSWHAHPYEWIPKTDLSDYTSMTVSIPLSHTFQAKKPDIR